MELTNKNAPIFVAGHNGLVGSSILRKLKSEGYTNILTKSSKELDLRNKELVLDFFTTYKPEYVFFAAGTVGGIMANKTYPADFALNNISMIANTIEAAHKNNVKKLLYLGSSCIYPKNAEQPIKEEYLLTGPLEETNKPYAIAKIAGIELCQSFRKQYQMDNICLMPTNLFGIRDNYDSQNSHLVAALIRKFHEAKISKKPFVELWGTGSPRREILYADHVADACYFFMKTYSSPEIINIGMGVDYSIADIAEMVKEITDFEGEVKYDATKPDGVPKKQLNVSKAESLGWKFNGNLKTDLLTTYKDFVENITEYTNK